MQRQVIVSSKMNITSCTCPFLINLPSEIIINIFLRLPIRTILSCRCVCKQLLDLLSTPEFAASHLSLSTPGLAIRQFGVNYDLCQIFEFEDEVELRHHNLHLNAVTKFDPSVSFGLSDFKLWISGSVNGILCLSGEGNALYLCNPITREYIALPRIESIVEHHDEFNLGFGVSRIGGQYKVVKNVYRCSPYNPAAPHSTIQNTEYECLVYTLGTRSWRNIQPDKPFGHSHSLFILFLNGNLHELRDCEHLVSMFISCFDLETESYIPFPPPPQPPDPPKFGTLGIFDDCLCFLANISRDSSALVIWVMKEYAVKESWTRQFVIAVSQNFVCTFYDAIYPIKAFKHGDILLYDYSKGTLFYFCNKTKTCKNLDLGIKDRRDRIDAIPHNSSFLSLKSFDGENVELFL